MRCVSLLSANALLLLSTSTKWGVLATPQITNYMVNYEESPQTYANYPSDEKIQAAIKDHDGDIKPVKVDYWSDVTHFGNPALQLVKGIVRRLDKYLITFQPLFLLTPGRSNGCRIVYPDGSEEPNIKDPQCKRNCTNYGRYCAATTPSDPSLEARLSGREIVNEQFHRMCVWVVYGKTGGDNSEHYWNYVSDLMFEQCEEPFGQVCIHEIMSTMGINEHFIHNCLEHVHGIDTDEPNPYMETMLSRQGQLMANDLPTFHIADTLYSGEYSTAAIFKTICNHYDEKKPVACEFCSNCGDVRRCLWFLECGTVKFEDYVQTLMAPEPVDIEATVVPTAGASPEKDAHVGNDPARPTEASHNPLHPGLTTSSSESATGEPSTLAEQKEAHVLRGLAAGLVVGIVIAAFFAYRDWRTKETLRSIIRASDIQNTPYTDDDSGELDLSDIDLHDPNHNGSSAGLPQLT